MPHRRPLVLLVDDEPMLRVLGVRTLRDGGYDVVTATDGSEALQHFAEHRGEIRAVVTDISMPGMTVIELADRLLQSGCSAPILFITGYADPSGVTLVGPLLRKPFSPDELLSYVRTAVTLPGPPVSH